MAKLILREAGGATTELDLEARGSVTIGRSPDCEIPISDSQASRRHCSVVRLQSGYEVNDLGSTNGTLVNSTLVKRHKLRHGDVIRIGSVEIVYDDPSAAGAGGEAAAGYLVYARGDRKGEKVELSAQRTTIGRKSTNTVVLDDPVCSSYHCEIVRDLNGYTIRDLGSTNGTLVNKEIVTEAQLTHGARVRIGNTRFVFQDPAMAEIDLELAGAEEEDEWGMMRDLDLAAVRKRNPATVVYALLFVALVGTGGYFVMAKPAAKAEEGPVAPQGNLHDPWSFESAASRFSWRAEPAGDVSIRVGTELVGAGRQSLELKCNVGSAQAFYNTSLSGSDVLYRLSGKVAVRGGAKARLGLLWTGLGLERWTSGPPLASGSLAPVEVVATAPPWGSRVRLGVMIEGQGTVHLDDVSLVRAGPPAVEQVEQHEFRFAVTDRRWGDVYHAAAPILVNGRLFARDAAGAEADASGLAVTIAAEDAEHVLVTIEGGAEAAVAGIVFDEVGGYLSRGGFRAFTPNDAKAFHPSFPDDGSLPLKGVRKLLLGPSGRAFAVLPGSDEGRLDAEARADGKNRTFALLGPLAEGRFSFRFKTDLRGETALADERMAAALSLHQAGKWGEFLGAAQQALAEFPFARKTQRDQLNELIRKVNEEYASLRMRVDSEIADYVAFKDLQDLADAAEAIATIRDRFQVVAGEGPRGTHLGEAEAKVRQLAGEARKRQQSALAEPIFIQANLVHIPSGEVHSAALQFAYVAWFLPEAEQAGPSGGELEKIRGSHPDVIEVLRKLGFARGG